MSDDEAPVQASLRPLLPSDTAALAMLFRASIFELTEEDYDADQQEAWAAAADDEAAFGARLAGGLTLVAVADGEPVGFVTVTDNKVIDMLYVHPLAAEQGVGTLLCNAAETLVKGRGGKSLVADASDTALGFFQARGYEAQQRNTVQRDDAWLANTTVKKSLVDGEPTP